MLKASMAKQTWKSVYATITHGNIKAMTMGTNDIVQAALWYGIYTCAAKPHRTASGINWAKHRRGTNAYRMKRNMRSFPGIGVYK
jgi:hypothetical protein